MYSMTKITSLFFLLFVSLSGFAQITLINQGTFYVSPGTTVYLSGVDLQNSAGATYTNEGDFYFAGTTFTNNGTMTQTTQGTTTFTGSNDQLIKGSEIANFNHLIINHTDGMVTQEENEVHTNVMTVNDGGADFDYRVQDAFPLYIQDNLTIDGDIRLIGDAQLVQTHTGSSQVSGTKYIWKDQQGTSNQYMYNYWSAPVNRGGIWKARYLKDGALGDNISQASYGDIRWADNYNATGDLPVQSHPVYLNAYWIYAFRNGPDGSYDGWFDNHIKHTGNLNPAEGYTMKGPGVDKDLNPANGASTTEYLSYTFSGLPNDGEYSVSIDADHDYLVGNPYPSAMDAKKFINDNNGKFNGNLYFWEHVTANDHYLASYEGGYATYNLTGGTAAVSWKDGTTPVGSKTPGQYVPVGQGFFIWAEGGQGGAVIFDNSQRAFQVEDGNNSVFIRPSKNSLTDIRIGFDIPGNYHRQLLLGIRPNTTLGVDYGWDGRNFDAGNPGADMNWNIDNEKYVIQAIPEINEDTKLPLYIEMSKSGIVGFTLDAAVNLPKQAEGVFIEDNLLNISKEITTDEPYKIFLDEGTYTDRFYLSFKGKTNSNTVKPPLENIKTYMDNTNSELVILNDKNKSLNTAQLYTITGQLILNKNLHTDEAEIRIPLAVSTGVYLVKIEAKDGKSLTTKIIIK